jgi:hypothetical protein
MKKVFIYVEGQTEEVFVRDVLAPYLERRCLLTPILAKTKRTKAGETFQGGISSYRQVKSDIQNLLRDSSVVLVTTMIDYYGLPRDFPGKSTLPNGTAYDRVRHLESAFASDIGDERFLPFLVLHEFEALVLVEPEKLESVLPRCERNVRDLIKDIGNLPPEEINEGYETHPAERIRRRIPGYQKRLHGPRVVEKTGIDVIRERCPHFRSWLEQLASL